MEGDSLASGALQPSEAVATDSVHKMCRQSVTTAEQVQERQLCRQSVTTEEQVQARQVEQVQARQVESLAQAVEANSILEKDIAHVAPGFAPSLPNGAPEAVQQWLRNEDWAALNKAWQEAEAQAIAWADGSDGEEVPGYWEASQTSKVVSSPSQGLPRVKAQKRRKKPQWDPDFCLLGNDHRKPLAQRRYFDKVPSEGSHSLPKSLRGDGHRSAVSSTFEPSQSLKSRRPWLVSWEQTVSPDNEALHPHLRHYFDRRGLESSYRNRPEVDATTKPLRCRTPGRPSTRDRILGIRGSASEPLLKGGQEDLHTMHWGARCRLYNSAAFKVEPRCVNGVTQRVPWVADHHVTVASDNEILNPALRHFFDCDGIESSYRNRGMHYGRPHRTIFGAVPGRKTTNTESSSGWTSIRSSILDQLSCSSLVDDSTPSGLPNIRTSLGQAMSGYERAV